MYFSQNKNSILSFYSTFVLFAQNNFDWYENHQVVTVLCLIGIDYLQTAMTSKIKRLTRVIDYERSILNINTYKYDALSYYTF